MYSGVYRIPETKHILSYIFKEVITFLYQVIGELPCSAGEHVLTTEGIVDSWGFSVKVHSVCCFVELI